MKRYSFQEPHGWNSGIVKPTEGGCCPTVDSGVGKWHILLIERSFKMTVKPGDKIRIIEMNGEPHYTGKEGIVMHIDAAGQIHGSWGGCALIPEEDKFEVINE